jgi:uncharacterized protein
MNIMDKNNILLILKNYKNQFADKYEIQSLGLFGSVAREESKEDSDVDICIVLNNPDLITLSRIRQELEEKIKVHVDLIQYRDRMNDYLKERIARDVIYV